ncbi:transcriptional regulator, DeoR family [Andreprevotia lacus DSM 23236]|jgi:DeoR/GlpR family transcriptional regulator of sugar metabolism|uniref:Transcriptional regulator, DeoR family n=2 Tax=Andreprevotia TaxID=397275 RepID=A0A1W1WWY4_9NEIS|nr:transcriptional regulator, DeoR family [Andreprevotia lacus DSM 23236]
MVKKFRANMLTSQRKQLILATLQRDGQLVAKTFSQQLEVSEDTIRRDLRELAAEGLLQRVHGGALPASPAVADFAGRSQIAGDGKARIGRAAAGLIEDGQVVLLDGGTTAVQLASQLPPALRATIVTHSPSVAVALALHPTVEVIMIGGRLFKHSVVTMGTAALESLGQIRADVFFMGVTGVHAEAGLSTGDLEEAYMKRALMARAAETVVLASAEKIAAASPYLIAGLDAVSGIITEQSVPDPQLAPLRQAGVALTLV